MEYTGTPFLISRNTSPVSTLADIGKIWKSGLKGSCQETGFFSVCFLTALFVNRRERTKKGKNSFFAAVLSVSLSLSMALAGAEPLMLLAAEADVKEVAETEEAAEEADSLKGLGDDYSWQYKNAAADSIVDEWNFYNRECTSFVAWCLNSRNGVSFTNSYGV